MIGGVADALRGLPENARLTVTFDRGSEFAAYPELARELAVTAYFCDPHKILWVRATAGRASVRASLPNPDGDVRCRSIPRPTPRPPVPTRPSSSSPWS